MSELDVITPLEEEFWQLYRPTGYLASAECIAGKVYWIGARRIWSVAVCKGKTAEGMAFRGIREKLGDYFLFDEYHHDDNDFFGTVLPYLELGDTPNFKTENELMYWLLDQEIELNDTCLEWLQRMPAKYKGNIGYQVCLQDTESDQLYLARLRTEGFEAQERLTFQAIMAKNKRAQGKPDS